jgi:DNA end-binding protein Ku
MRATAKATVSFGLVAIPVKVYTATETGATVHFNQLCAACKGRLKQHLHCEACDERREQAQIVKGYEYIKGQYLVFTEDELKAVQEESTKAIEIAEFLPLGAVDPLYFDKPYYLGPEPAATRPYALLVEAMRRAGLVALAQFAIRGKQYLVLLRATDRGLAMHQLLYAHELREQEQEATVGLRDEEMAFAAQLINKLRRKTFDPSRYEDGVRTRMLDAIDQKAKDGSITVAAPDAAKPPILDLMAALKASLEASEPRVKNAAPKRTRRKAS